MLRKLLLPIIATVALAGCATDYNYRGGNGDYYYGQPRTEYRYQGMGGYYGSYGFGANYYYDSFGRLIYGYPGGYYGSPYYGGNGWYRPRQHRDRDDRDDHDDHGGNGEQQDRPPPWRDLGRLQQRDGAGFRNREDSREDTQRPMRPARPMTSPDAPMRQLRQESNAPMIRQNSDAPVRMGSFSGGAARSHDKRNPTPEE
ncbi:MAG: hypothetical protein ACMG50_08800 [Thermomonas sp.]